MWVNLKIYYKCGYRPKMFSERKLKKKKKRRRRQWSSLGKGASGRNRGDFTVHLIACGEI